MTRGWLFLCAVLFFACPASAGSQQAAEPPDAAQVALINNGIGLLKQGQTEAAITEAFDKAIAAYEQGFRDDKRKILAARTQAETISYLLRGTLLKENVVVLSWASVAAYYYKGYALNELGDVAEAKKYLARAAALSPDNAMVLLELGNVHLKQADLVGAFQLFVDAAKAAPNSSPDDMKNAELGQAWRQMGYVFVEQGKLDEAEELYLRCLKLDKNDRKAAGELQYVRAQKAKAGSRGN
jgi:tetratricopeptide (TPR) repeat protein